MAIKVLFFDTSVLIKFFVTEEGSDIVNWLVSNRIAFSLRLVINEKVCSEFLDKIRFFSNTGKVAQKEIDGINRQFTDFYKGKVFKVIGQETISNAKLNYDLNSIIKELGLTTGKNDWDALHYQSIINALGYLGGESRPVLVTADSAFGKIVTSKGYRVINPTKQSTEEIEELWSY